jgi:hypothetical protein
MKLPHEFLPVKTEPFCLPNSRIIAVPKATPVFALWRGQDIPNKFGNKPVLDYAGKAVFPELAILGIFQAAGWSGRWISVYGASLRRPRFLRSWNAGSLAAQIHEPLDHAPVQNLLERIAIGNGGTYSGCWDIIAWHGKNVLFVESKHAGQDNIRATQRRWFCSAMAEGLTESSFLIVEWSAA